MFRYDDFQHDYCSITKDLSAAADDLRMKTPTRRNAVGIEPATEFVASCEDGPSTNGDGQSSRQSSVQSSRPQTVLTEISDQNVEILQPLEQAPMSQRATTTSSQRQFRVQGELTKWEPANVLQPD